MFPIFRRPCVANVAAMSSIARIRRRMNVVAIALAATVAIPFDVAADSAVGATAGRWDRQLPVLELRATHGADAYAPGPASGARSTPANGRTPPYAGQVIPGFSGMVDNGDGTFWAMPDNGFGAKGNSGDFLLRLYLIAPEWEGADGGAGTVNPGEFISLPRSSTPDPVPDRQRDDERAVAHR